MSEEHSPGEGEEGGGGGGSRVRDMDPPRWEI